jgi:hypothetical protein
MSNPTPGPWRVMNYGRERADGRFNILAVWVDDNSRQIATVGNEVWDEEHEANARLIAAAPDLLAVTEAFRRECLRQGIKFGPLIADAEAAIAKARGEQP